MKNKYIIITILIVSLIVSIVKIISVDKKNKELLINVNALNSKVNTLESKISSIQTEKQSLEENMKPRTLIYINYEYKYRFTDKEIKIYQSPKQEFNQIDILKPNTAIEVEDAVRIDNDEIWLFVKLPINYDSANLKGWIREKDTMPITKENQVKIRNISIKEGSQVYKFVEFDEIKGMKPSILDRDFDGNIMQKKDGYYEIGCVGGLVLWVEEKYIVYPPIE